MRLLNFSLPPPRINSTTELISHKELIPMPGVFLFWDILENVIHFVKNFVASEFYECYLVLVVKKEKRECLENCFERNFFL
jgi:hypothetical protein